MYKHLGWAGGAGWEVVSADRSVAKERASTVPPGRLLKIPQTMEGNQHEEWVENLGWV